MEQPQLTLIDQLGNDPLHDLDRWIREAEASGVKEPNAMALATATKDGRPSVRIVLAKGIESDAVHFFTNYESRKAEELSENPRASAVFHWVTLSRQVRLEGTVVRLSAEESQAYFATRPRGSQIAAWASHQSQTVTSYAALTTEFEQLHKRFGETALVPCPPHWGGFALTPTLCEFWLGMPSRLHDRVKFERSGAAWLKRQLAP